MICIARCAYVFKVYIVLQVITASLLNALSFNARHLNKAIITVIAHIVICNIILNIITIYFFDTAGLVIGISNLMKLTFITQIIIYDIEL